MAYTTIDNPGNHHGRAFWTADDTSPRTITGFSCKPDILLGRHRNSGSVNFNFNDSSRGGNKNMTPQTTAAEDSGSHGIIDSYNSNGITVSNGTNSTYPRLYYNRNNPFGGSDGGKYVYFYWKANGGTTSSNTDGDITTTTQVDQTSGCSIITWQETTANSQNIGHGLGVAPEFIIVKDRDSAIGWYTYHVSLGNTKRLGLEVNGSGTTTSFWNNADPTSTTFHVGMGDSYDNDNMLAYAFAPIKGYSKFSKYTGNGLDDGPFVHLGFTPNFVLIKSISASEHWNIPIFETDANGTVNTLSTNLATGERTMDDNPAIDFLSHGFKIRTSDANYNTSGSNYIYAAFAQHPFVTSTGTPTVAR